jgi:inner membrane protein
LDSITQIALGAAVGEAVIGRQVGRKAMLWGAMLGTLPDLDVFIPLGDAVKDFTYHRSFSHSFFVLAILTPLMVWLINKIHPQWRELRNRWALMVYLVFVTHILLDGFTAYGTQIFWPFVTTPVSWSTVFIIDPLFTLPLIIGVGATLVVTRNVSRARLVNRAGLVVSSLYLCWTIVAKQIVEGNITKGLSDQNISYQKLFTTPSPFNSLLWRAVVMDESGYYEVYASVFDSDNAIRLRHYKSDEYLLGELGQAWVVQRLKWFSKGFYSVNAEDGYLVISDLRMGLEPNYAFRFRVAEIQNPHPRLITPEHIRPQWDFGLLEKMWQRVWSPQLDLRPTTSQ